MLNDDRYIEVLDSLWRAHATAGRQDFKNMWMIKIREIQRSELYELKLLSQQGIRRETALT